MDISMSRLISYKKKTIINLDKVEVIYIGKDSNHYNIVFVQNSHNHVYSRWEFTTEEERDSVYEVIKNTHITEIKIESKQDSN